MVLAIRGTASMIDVTTNLNSSPQSFPPPPSQVRAVLSAYDRWRRSTSLRDQLSASHGHAVAKRLQDMLDGQRWQWETVPPGATYGNGGFCRAAMWLLAEVGPVLLDLAEAGWRVVVVGHSMGAAVAALLTVMLKDFLRDVSCWTYGCPPCVDAVLADDLMTSGVVTSVVIHDDVVSRISPASIR